MLRSIDKVSEWAFARNEQMGGELREAHNALLSCITPFLQQVLLTQPNDLRNAYGADYLATELPNFVALKARGADIDRKIAQLQRVFKAMGKP